MKIKIKLPIFLITAMCVSPAFANDKMSDKEMNAKADHYFNKMDTNSDGKVTAEEHEAFARDKFKEADTNNDGSLTKDELRAAKKKEHADKKKY